MRHINAVIKGKVQGVFFRASAKEKAEELGLKGIVENHSDGSVYLEAEGSEDKINELIEWCKKGPQQAVVDEVLINDGALKNYTDFSIRR
jgi:acylphosphatase